MSRNVSVSHRLADTFMGFFHITLYTVFLYTILHDDVTAAIIVLLCVQGTTILMDENTSVSL